MHVSVQRRRRERTREVPSFYKKPKRYVQRPEQLVIAQANAQWRQQLATINNVAQNEANRQDALQANALTQKGLDEIWQRERDIMAYAFTSAENAENRRVALMQENLNADAVKDSAFSTALGTFAGAIVNGIFT